MSVGTPAGEKKIIEGNVWEEFSKVVVVRVWGGIFRIQVTGKVAGGFGALVQLNGSSDDLKT